MIRDKKKYSKNAKFYTVTIGGKIYIQGTNTLLEGVVEIPHGVFSIAPQSFMNRHEITEVIIPDTVEKIDVGAFIYCTSLRKVTIPNSVKCIERNAFHGTALESVVLPDSIEYIGENAFGFCEKLEDVKFTRGTDKIPANCFYKCSSLEHIDIPDTVKYIGISAFGRCYSLDNVVIPESVETIQGGAFEFCENLNSISITDKTTYIGVCAFAKHKRKESVEVPPEPVRAYKAFDRKDGRLVCRNFTYWEDGIFETEYAEMCYKGFHACTDPLDVFSYYSGIIGDTVEVHEVLLEGIPDDIDPRNCDDSKLVGTKITIGRKLSLSEISKIHNGLVMG